MTGNWTARIAALGLAAGLSAGGGQLAAAELSAVDLTEIEQNLAQLNFDPGTIDGVVDDRTRTAIRLYQEFAVLPVDGEPTAKLLAELRQVSQAFAEMHTDPSAGAAPAPEAVPEPEIAPAPQVAEATPVEAPPAPASAPVQATPPPPPVPTPEVAPEAAAEAAQALPTEAPNVTVPAADPPAEQAAPAPAPKVAEPEIASLQPQTAPMAEAKKPEPAKIEPKKSEPAKAEPGKVASFSIESMITRLKKTGGTAIQAPSQAPTQAAAVDQAGYERTLTWKAQQELQRIGLDPGPADGTARARTKQAIETYQRARGLPADGQVSEELLARLEAEATPAVPPKPGDTAAPGLDPAQSAAATPVPQNGYGAFRAGYGAAQSGDLNMAVKLYDQAVDSGDLALEHLAVALYNRANALQYLGVLDKAIDDYSAAIANKPGFPAAYYNRGFAYDAKGEQTRAVEDFRKARDLGLQRLGVRSPDLPPPQL